MCIYVCRGKHALSPDVLFVILGLAYHNMTSMLGLYAHRAGNCAFWPLQKPSVRCVDIYTGIVMFIHTCCTCGSLYVVVYCSNWHDAPGRWFSVTTTQVALSMNGFAQLTTT